MATNCTRTGADRKALAAAIPGIAGAKATWILPSGITSILDLARSSVAAVFGLSIMTLPRGPGFRA